MKKQGFFPHETIMYQNDTLLRKTAKNFYGRFREFGLALQAKVDFGK